MSPATLPTRTLGRGGPPVTAIGFGLMGLHAFYGTPKTDEECFALLDRALELGCTFWDTSDIYGGNEDMLGRWFKRTGKRDQIFLATKFASTVDSEGNRIVRGDRNYVFEACERSLKRLGISQIDLYYQHRVDAKVPVEETVTAMSELVKAGKVRYLGISECSAATLRRAYAIHPIAAVQVEYSPFTLDIEHPDVKLLATCRELGVATVAYSPLGRGMLTGKYKSRLDFEEGDFRRYAPRFSDENFHTNMELVEKIGAIAKKKNATAGQLTLAWLLTQGEDIIPIPGTTKIANLEENIGAFSIKLTPEEVAEIRKYVDEAEVAGLRYPSAFMHTVLVDTPPLPK